MLGYRVRLRKNITFFKAKCSGVIFTIVTFSVWYFIPTSSTELLALTGSKLKFLDDIPLEMGFQPFVDVEFPHVETDVPRIPHNIHQIWIRHHNNTEIDIEVPEQFEQYMKTFPKWNPSWKYYFWTHKTSRKLLEERHPELLTFYDKTLVPVQKSDLMRYVVVYEFGGLYADLDTSCLRSLDIVTTKYACIVLPEPFEDGIIWENIPYRIPNGVFFCRAKHPFLEQVLRTISGIKTVEASPTLIGPLFYTTQYRRYNNISDTDMYRVNISGDTSSPYFYKGELPESHDDAIYIPNTRYFLDQPHPWHRDKIKRICENPSKATLIIKRMCVVYTRRGFDRKPSNFTFLEHAYTFSFNSKIDWSKRKYIPVKKIQSNVQTYNGSRSLI
ncbi:uncharacterized protein LOC127852357 [Dreissena polymorpha]|uniref:uncharacterized protein LOC127852357 n=1 Tax=Dreissena polymorpha TaxID=45954 RepID=UPI002263E90E|nr:uncharacterized protein LOC127852357 [Dreissena polymorpha]